MNFFTSPATAQDWLASHPTVSGVVLTQGQTLRLSVDIFGHLLDD
jgi:L-lysine 2,3-aminomutase